MLLTEQWCLLAHLRYKVDLYHLTIHLCQHHCLGCYVHETPELCLQRVWCRALVPTGLKVDIFQLCFKWFQDGIFFHVDHIPPLAV